MGFGPNEAVACQAFDGREECIPFWLDAPPCTGTTTDPFSPNNPANTSRNSAALVSGMAGQPLPARSEHSVGTPSAKMTSSLSKARCTYVTVRMILAATMPGTTSTNCAAAFRQGIGPSVVSSLGSDMRTMCCGETLRSRRGKPTPIDPARMVIGARCGRSLRVKGARRRCKTCRSGWGPLPRVETRSPTSRVSINFGPSGVSIIAPVVRQTAAIPVLGRSEG